MKASAEPFAARVEFRVTDQEMAAFRLLSGDDNPLHHDADFARRRGFEGPVVYGGLIIAQVSRLLGTELPGAGCVWRSLTFKFRAPLYVGVPALASATIVHANEELGLYHLKIAIEASGRAIAEGEAAALLLEERRHEFA
jgi:3-hydroxybutyryl-CoA dehydratase